ncbi:hypothetical protein FJ543_21990 [Mesorhizobium sp. B2-5-7]|nr:hypothetical protein FJ543_21990 [Mesorhizobium sp. B2-5-7]
MATADTPSVGRITLVALAMSGEDALPPTPATGGRVPTVNERHVARYQERNAKHKGAIEHAAIVSG